MCNKCGLTNAELPADVAVLLPRFGLLQSGNDLFFGVTLPRHGNYLPVSFFEDLIALRLLQFRFARFSGFGSSAPGLSLTRTARASNSQQKASGPFWTRLTMTFSRGPV